MTMFLAPDSWYWYRTAYSEAVPHSHAFVARIIRAMGTGKFRERALQSGALDPDFLETTLFEDLLSAPALKGEYTDLNEHHQTHHVDPRN